MSNYKSSSFSVNLSKIMELKGISMKKLSQACNVPYSTIFGWVAGKHPSNIEYLRRVADFLEADLFFLLFGRDDPNSIVNKKSPILLDESFKMELSAYQAQILLGNISRKI